MNKLLSWPVRCSLSVEGGRFVDKCAVHVRCVQGAVSSSIPRKEREPGRFHREGDTCGRTRSGYQVCEAGKSSPGREQNVKSPGSLKRHSVFCHRERSHMASPGHKGSDGKWGGQSPPLTMSQLRYLDAILYHHELTFYRVFLLPGDSVEEGWRETELAAWRVGGYWNSLAET